MLAPVLKGKLARGEPTFGAWLTLAHVSVAEILAGAGIDWVVIDMEHTAIDLSEVLRLMPAIERLGVAPLVRVARNDPSLIKSVMDQGAAGVIVPDIRSRAEAERAVAAVKYPPQGSRGVGLARAHGYGPDFDDHFRRNNDESIVIVQLEHIEAVRVVDEILAVERIDATFIGPYDLSASMGLAGQLEHPDVLDAGRRILAASRGRGIAPGLHLIHPDRIPDQLRSRIAEGFRFFALGSDALVLGSGYRSLAATARAASDATVGR